jgi:ABC-2 type transport system ATP-binding protein
MTVTSPLIQTRGLSKHYGGRAAVSDVNLNVPAGCAYGFLGHNGAGKTTVIRMLLGLTRPDAGTVHIDGHRLDHDRAATLSRVGAIIEEPRFHAHLTGFENLRIIAAARGPEAHGRIRPALQRVGLSDRGTDRVGTYSQGMRQRLGIARTLLADPKLIILDEPTNGLDPGGILELRHLVAEFVSEGRTVFISSHILDEIQKICQFVAVIDRGRLVADGTVAELIGETGTEYELICNDQEAALKLLTTHPAVTQTTVTPAGIRLTVNDQRAGNSITSWLVRSGIEVASFTPVHHTLEDRFLALTTRVGDNV